MLPYRVLILLFLSPLAYAAELYRFGADEADQEISFSNDPSAVTLDVPIIYFEEAQNELFISANGVVSFGRPIAGPDVKNLDTERTSAIAVFYVPTSGGTVYYR
ncbi:unnamed protein product [Toxocara canis]|uniref:T9SS type A sorting domain-containing protein n=1 Tax=Toxocara canis TaxID=6265 RepID=A0A183VHH7_TOXCA|nr:unnamed protein product [Toxocara canis]